MRMKILPILASTVVAMAVLPASATIVVSQTTDSNDLATALNATGLTINSVSITNGADEQFGTYSGFDSGPVTFSDGLVLSTGYAVDTAGPAKAHAPNSEMGVSGTQEFNAYGGSHITNFSDSHDVAALKIDFTLSQDSQIAFDFIFGSIEYPEYTAEYTDAFLAFLDGTDPADQITFDSNGDAVQVGNSFASKLTESDTNTAFGDPHGLITSLTTFSPILTAGTHSLLFEVGDVNDARLDSAVFLANLRTGSGQIGTNTVTAVPAPGTFFLFAGALLGLVAASRRRLTR